MISIQTETAVNAASVPALASAASSSSGMNPARIATTIAVKMVIRTGVPRDDTLALHWYQAAAAQGDARAASALGWVYGEGRGVPRDPALSLHWLRIAAGQGDPNAEHNLGMALLNGHGVSRDPVEAERWIRKAADAGYAPAQVSLGLMYAAGEAVTEMAARLGWPIPDEVCVLDLSESGAVELGADALVDSEQQFAVLGAPVSVASLPQLPITVGCTVPIADAAASLRWARLASRLRAAGVLAGEPVLACDDHIPALLLEAEPNLAAVLVRHRLEPLLAVPAPRRTKFARLLSCWLEHGGSQADLAGQLAMPRQTVHYQLCRLQELFGADLQDPDARVEIMLALRAVLPRWELAADRP